MQPTQEFIDKYCDGDPNKYDSKAIEEGRRELITWDQIMTCAKVFPELEEDAHNEIKRHLGYLPNPSAYMNHEVFIRTLIHQFRNQEISEEDYNQQVIAHVKHVRNDDMLQGGHIDCLGWPVDLDMQRYNTHFSQYKDKALLRLKFLMGYESDLRYSLYPELMIRELCAMDWYTENMPPCTIDYMAITIIHYRKAMITFDKEFADALPLMAV